ncbi:MAG: type VI secretion system baseplate subunit TssE [Gemmataceae bacterium]
MPPPPAAVLPSVVDRFLDPEAMAATATGAPVAAVVESVRRDVEDLLNSRRPADPDLDQYPELSRSVFAYGIPELVCRPAATGPDREAIGRLLAEAIARHEPRLRDVSVALIPDPGGTDRTLRYRVSARLRLDPAPGVEFETVLRLATGQTSLLAARA